MHLTRASAMADAHLAVAGEAALRVASSAERDGHALRGSMGASRCSRAGAHPLAGLQAPPPDGKTPPGKDHPRAASAWAPSGGLGSRVERAAMLFGRPGPPGRSEGDHRRSPAAHGSRLDPSSAMGRGPEGLAAAARNIQHELLPRLHDVRASLQRAVVELEAQTNHVGAAVDRLRELSPAPKRTALTPQDRVEDLVRRTAISMSSAVRQPPPEQSALNQGHSFFTSGASESDHRPASHERVAVARVQRMLRLLRKQVAETGDQLEALEAARRTNRGWDATFRLDSWIQPVFPAGIRNSALPPKLCQVIARARAVAKWAPVVSGWGAQLLVAAATAPAAARGSRKGPHREVSRGSPAASSVASPAGVDTSPESSSPSDQGCDKPAGAIGALEAVGYPSSPALLTPAGGGLSPGGFSGRAHAAVSPESKAPDFAKEEPVGAVARGAVLAETVQTAKGVFSEATRWDERIAGARGQASQKYAWTPRLFFGKVPAVQSCDSPEEYAKGLRAVPAAAASAAADALKHDSRRLSAFASLVADTLDRCDSVQGLSPREAVKLAASFEACARACVDCDALADDAMASRGVFSSAGGGNADSVSFDWADVGWKPQQPSPPSGSMSARELGPRSPLAPVQAERSRSDAALTTSVDDRHVFGHGFTGLIADCLDGGGPLGSLRRPARLTATAAKVQQVKVARLAERVLVAERRVRLACLRQHLLATLAQLADILADSEAEGTNAAHPSPPESQPGLPCRRTDAAPQGFNGLNGKAASAACMRVAIRQLVVPLSAVSCHELLHSAHWAGGKQASGAGFDEASASREFASGLQTEAAALATASKSAASCFRVLGLLREAEEYDVSLTAQPWLGWHDEAALNSCDPSVVPIQVRSRPRQEPESAPDFGDEALADPDGKSVPSTRKVPGKFTGPSNAARRPSSTGLSLWRRAKARLGVARSLVNDGGASFDAHRLRHVIESLSGQEAGRASDDVMPDEFVRCVGGRELHPEDDATPADHAVGHIVRETLFDPALPSLHKSQRMRARAIQSEASLAGWAGIRSRLMESGEAFALFDLHVRTLLVQAVLQSAVSDRHADGTGGGRALLALDSRTVEGPQTSNGSCSRLVHKPMSVVVMIRATPEGMDCAAAATGEPLRVVWDPQEPANRTSQTRAASRADAKAIAAVAKATMFAGVEPKETAFVLSDGPCRRAEGSAQGPLWWDSLRLTAWLPFEACAAFSALRIHERLQPRSLGSPSAAALDTASADSPAWQLQAVTAQTSAENSGSVAANLANSERLLVAADRLCKRLDKAFASLDAGGGADTSTADGRQRASAEQHSMESMRQRAAAARAKALDSVCKGLASAVEAWESDLSARAAPRLFAPPARRRLLRCLLLALPWPDAAMASLVSHEDCPRPEKIHGELAPLVPQSVPALLASAASAARKQLEPMRPLGGTAEGPQSAPLQPDPALAEGGLL